MIVFISFCFLVSGLVGCFLIGRAWSRGRIDPRDSVDAFLWSGASVMSVVYLGFGISGMLMAFR